MTNAFANTVQGLASAAIQIAGDLAPTVVYTPNGSSVYDPVSGVVTNVAAPITLHGVLSKFGFEETDKAVVVSTDAKLLLAASDLGVSPNENDTLTCNGKTWRVIRSLGVPGNALYKLHIREI
jgi:hypothetical protein